METDQELFELASKIGKHLKRARQRLVLAESCTGGWMAKVITDVAGSSQWFEGSFVTYSNDAKVALLGVEARTLESEGAVSEATVTEMAKGALERTDADVAVAVSGIAGPDGAVPGKPIGSVWIAWAWRHGQAIRSRARLKMFDGERDAVRRRAVKAALEGLLTS